jgi:uracil-DNA glycosylase
VAFHGPTNSSKRLTKWTENVLGAKVHINVLDKKTENNRPLKKSEISLNLEDLKLKLNMIKPHKIVALGKTAQKALNLVGVDFFAMPHPSGKNRKLNDKLYVEKIVEEMLAYVNEKVD